MLKEPVSYVRLEIWGVNFIICSNAFNTQHKKTIPLVHWKYPYVLKFHDLMKTEDVSLLTKVASFCKTIVMFFDTVNK